VSGVWQRCGKEKPQVMALHSDGSGVLDTLAIEWTDTPGGIEISRGRCVERYDCSIGTFRMDVTTTGELLGAPDTWLL
jgi:hypothetical protein